MTEPDAPDESLLGDRLRHGLGQAGGYPPPAAAGHYGRLIALGRLRGRRLTDLARAALRARRRRARPPVPAPATTAAPPAPELPALFTDAVLVRSFDQMTLHAGARRLAGMNARPVARLLAPARILGHRVLAPTFEAQEAFNEAALASIDRLSALVAAQQQRIAELEDARVDT
jgi:hypothetical protein